MDKSLNCVFTPAENSYCCHVKLQPTNNGRRPTATTLPSSSPSPSSAMPQQQCQQQQLLLLPQSRVGWQQTSLLQWTQHSEAVDTDNAKLHFNVMFLRFVVSVVVLFLWRFFLLPFVVVPFFSSLSADSSDVCGFIIVFLVIGACEEDISEWCITVSYSLLLFAND